MFYGVNPPWDELRAFDVVVVEPLHVPDPKPHASAQTALFAYVSVGEVAPDRGYLRDIPQAWRLGTNADWAGTVLDQTQPEWPTFFVERVIKPLWDAGYRGFFLDTLDSYQLYARTDAERSSQEAGLVAVIREVKKRYPQARLIFNRGFEILPQVHQQVFAVATESLFQGWNQRLGQYSTVSEADREWLLGQLTRIRDEYHLPVLAIDYVPPAQRTLARETAEKIRRLGFVPWVSNPELDMIGVGEIEVMPRKILLIQNSADTEYDLVYTNGFRHATMPLNYLGYQVEYLDARRPLPEMPLPGRYAGIVVWLERVPGREAGSLAAWLQQQIQSGMPVVILGEMGFLLARSDAALLGLNASRVVEKQTHVRVDQRDALIGYEVEPVPDRQAFFPLRASGSKPLLTLANDKNEKQEAVALTAWGGYALDPYVLVDVPHIGGDSLREAGKNVRWVFNPFEFFRSALRLPAMPVPDVTTESGRRMLMVHMDGDGFVSRAEFPGAPYASEVMLDKILKRYPLPSTISIIQGEIAADGLYAAQSDKLERVARAMFALPHVEMASHSFSHPFLWRKAVANPEEEGYHLSIANYTFDLAKEITGSIDYMNSRLAPPGKQVRTFLWTGDTNIGSDALALAERNGVVSMNGGDTLITRSHPYTTLVAPLGIPKGALFQVYAPNQNENVYTNNWTGPFYGYERAIETFELTDTPYRLKPVDIYYHTYSASKPASLRALDRVYRWALARESTPVFASEYVRKVLDFNRMVVARTAQGWMVRGNGDVRELRVPLALGYPDIGSSLAVAGYSRHGDARYVHLADGEARLRFGSVAAQPPYLVSANARIVSRRQDADPAGTKLALALSGNVPLKFALALTDACTVHGDGKKLAADATKLGIKYFSLTQHAINELRIYCPR